jgi:hypothetical protein
VPVVVVTVGPVALAMAAALAPSTPASATCSFIVPTARPAPRVSAISYPTSVALLKMKGKRFRARPIAIGSRGNIT